MKANLLLLFITLTSPSLLLASNLPAYTAKYEDKLQQIRQTRDQETARLGEQYVTSLEALFVRVRKAGDLEKTTRVAAELKRFRTEQTMPGALSNLPEIMKLQSSYTRAAAGIEASAAKKVILLSSALDRALHQLQRQLVTGNKLEEAQAVQDERKRIQNSESVQHARKVNAANTRPPETTPTDSDSPSPDEIEKFMGHSYYWLPVQYTFSEARDLCKDLGGHLVSIDHEREYEFIKDYITRKKSSIWLDITDEQREGRWQNWRGMRPSFLKWDRKQPDNAGGSEHAACLVPGRDMNDVSLSAYHRVLCEWDTPLRASPKGPATVGLCEIRLSGRGSVQTLKPGSARLSGGFPANFSYVSGDLQGAAFLRVPWQSNPTHRITVTKPGFLYLIKSSTESREGLPWAHLPGAVRGSYLKSGAHRLRVTEGQTLAVSGYEASVIAAAIILQ